MAPQSASFWVRRVRLTTGLVLFAYVLTHLLNHAAGLISLDALDASRLVFVAVWRHPALTLALYASLATHFLLALWAVYQRRRLFHIRPAEALQLVLGLAIIPLLAKHALGTRYAAEAFNVTDNYIYVLLFLWHLDPEAGARQAAALVVAWIHGCLGVYFWLRLKPVYARLQPLLFAGALLVPVLALLGYFVAGRQVAELAQDPAWLRAALADIEPPDAAQVAQISALHAWTLRAFAAGLALALLARLVRLALARRRGLVKLIYPGGREVLIAPGTSILEASQMAGIPHASVCGGRGRCSTCRVRISRGLEALPPPSAQECAVLKRVAASPNVRLACQTRPRAELAVAPLLPAATGPRGGFVRPAHAHGQEKEIAVLFADLRGFTAISERKLPYDVVFVLNRYFAAMGQAIEQAGGRLDKFIGDGVMALFGIESGPERGARQALAAARAMAATMDQLNQTLTHDLDRPLRLGIGIHLGAAIVGEMGYARAVSLTAVGDTVNIASRLESLTKEFGVELVVSDALARAAGVDLAGFPLHEMEIRGRLDALAVRAIARAAEIPEPVRAPNAA
jgi:adenylate cyclase